MNKTLNYYFIFIAPVMNDIMIRYNDLNKVDNAGTIYNTPGNKKPHNSFLALLYIIHLSKKINQIINLPFKNIWKENNIYSSLPKISPNLSNPFCFIIYARFFEYLGEEGRKNFIQYLRSEYKNCKIVIFYADLVNTYSFDFREYNNSVDACISFDKKNASDNNLLYYKDQPFSSNSIKRNLFFPSKDVLFIGKAKNRTNMLIDIMKLFEKHGVTYDFHIVEAPKSEQKYKEKIHYHDGYITYNQLLQHVISSRCILEILQDGGNSHTARVSEAIFYDKKILSNCSELKTRSYYNPNYISIFSDYRDINIDFLKARIDSIDYNYKQNLSPLRLIEYIDTYFGASI